MSQLLTTDNQLDSHLKPLKSGEELSSLELSSKGNGARFTGDVDVVGGFVKGDTPTADNHLATKKYVDDNAGGGGGSATWSKTMGGYKTNNNSASNYYFAYYTNENLWSNSDSSPTTLSYTDAWACEWEAPSDGSLTKISVILRGSDTGTTDPVKFYVYKGTPADESTSTSLIGIGVTDSITPVANKQMVATKSITSANTFNSGDKLWIMYKKDSTSGNQDLYFAVTISGEFS